jgi:hypothetical protein
MSRRISAAFAGLALALMLPGCSKTFTIVDADVGLHHVRFELPNGWEHLDHGRQQLIRRDESEISLVDLGPATRDAMVRELRVARSLWSAGRGRDAMEHVRELRTPLLRFASSEQRAEFWRPWTDATYALERTDSPALARAIDDLIEGARRLDEPTPDLMLAYVLALTDDRIGREVESRTRKTIHGREWTVVETWNRVSHLDRSRLAFTEHDGNLLVLAMDRGPFERTGDAFDAVLSSLDVTQRAAE